MNSDRFILNRKKKFASVLGIPIRDCARGCNNRGHTRAQMSAIDVTKITFFERLYLVLGLRKFAP